MATITILNTVEADITTPDAGKTQVFIDNNKMKLKSSDGSVAEVGGNFLGDMQSNSLFDSTNKRVQISASPSSAPAPLINNFGWAGLVTNLPTYTGTDYTPAYDLQTVGGVIQANLVMPTAGPGTQNRQSAISSVLGQVTPQTNLRSRDRVRLTYNVLEANLNGYAWGADNTNRAPLIASTSSVMISGNGSVGGSTCYSCTVEFPSATDETNSVTNVHGFNGYIGSYGAGTTNITNAHMYTCQFEAGAGTITNVIGFYIGTNMVDVYGTGAVTNKYAIKIDDATAPIVTAGAIATANTLTVGNYASSAMPTGSIGMMVAVNDAGGKMAYWDTTNSRWSYVFDNSAV